MLQQSVGRRFLGRGVGLLRRKCLLEMVNSRSNGLLVPSVSLFNRSSIQYRSISSTYFRLDASSSSPSPPPPPPPPPELNRFQRLVKFVKDQLFKVKWILIRSKRPFNFEDFTAMFSWLITGNVFLFLVGTTTFVSLVLLTGQYMDMQQRITSLVGKAVTDTINLKFHSGNIEPDWTNGAIKLTQCSIIKRPRVVSTIEHIQRGSRGEIIKKTVEDVYDDGNYTQFELTVDEITIRLSFWKWISGRGIIDTARLNGIRGIVDRTHVVWKPNDDPRNYKNIPAPGDWEIENLKLEDLFVTIYQPYEFRPCKLSIYNADIPLLRKNWVMLDILTCNHLSGAYDGSLFTLNKISNLDTFKDELRIDQLVKRRLGYNQFTKIDLTDIKFQRATRFRIDNLKFDHMNKGVNGPLGWITKGSVDLIMDMVVLGDDDDKSLNEILLSELYQKFNQLPQPRAAAADTTVAMAKKPMDNLFICDFYMNLKNPKAAIPLFNDSLNPLENTAIRPIIGYINNRKTMIPLRCRIVKELSDFDGSWTMYDSLFMPDITQGVYSSFYEYATDEKLRTERLRKVGAFSVQFLVQCLLWSLTFLNR